MDAYHRDHPEQPNIGTEQGSTVSTRGIYTNDPGRGYVSAYDENYPAWAQTAENCQLADRATCCRASACTGSSASRPVASHSAPSASTSNWVRASNWFSSAGSRARLFLFGCQASSMVHTNIAAARGILTDLRCATWHYSWYCETV